MLMNDMKKKTMKTNKIIDKDQNWDNINHIKVSQGVDTNPHTIQNKFNNYFTTIQNQNP